MAGRYSLFFADVDGGVSEHHSGDNDMAQDKGVTSLFESEMQRLMTDECMSYEEARFMATDYVNFMQKGGMSIGSSTQKKLLQELDPPEDIRDEIDKNRENKQLKKNILHAFQGATYATNQQTWLLDESIKELRGYKGFNKKTLLRDVMYCVSQVKEIRKKGAFVKGSVAYRSENKIYKHTAQGTKATLFRAITKQYEGYWRKKSARDRYKYIIYYVVDNCDHFDTIIQTYKK